ncbi:MAG: hypothetical protein JOY53_15940, partial [Acidobacteriaceae bacterium]|nr:hypothetical protein [Acidobacteriaceae bacterium]
MGITLLVRYHPAPPRPSAFGADLYGTREEKYSRLQSSHAGADAFVPLNPKSPNYFFVEKDEAGMAEYEQFTPIPNLFEVGGLGFQSHRDNLVVAFSEHELKERMKNFFDLNSTDADVKKEFGINDYERFIVSRFRRENAFNPRAIRRIQYRSMDYRFVYYADLIIQRWLIRVHG